MKFCAKCGKEILDEAVVCVNCGCKVDVAEIAPQESAPATEKPKAAMILGIIGIVFAWLLALVGHAVSIVGIIIGIKEYKSTNYMTGLILSIVGEVCAIFSSIIGAAMMASAF